MITIGSSCRLTVSLYSYTFYAIACHVSYNETCFQPSSPHITPSSLTSLPRPSSLIKRISFLVAYRSVVTTMRTSIKSLLASTLVVLIATMTAAAPKTVSMPAHSSTLQQAMTKSSNINNADAGLPLSTPTAVSTTPLSWPTHLNSERLVRWESFWIRRTIATNVRRRHYT